MPGFPLHRFWRVGRYFESEFAFQLGTREAGSVFFPVGTHFLCVKAETRPFCQDPNDPDADITGVFVSLVALHPETNQPVHIEFFPHTQGGWGAQFSVVENEMLILALASTGLVL